MGITEDEMERYETIRDSFLNLAISIFTCPHKNADNREAESKFKEIKKLMSEISTIGFKYLEKIGCP